MHFLILLAISVTTPDVMCQTAFDFVVARVSNDYAGFKDKVTPASQKAFQELTADSRRRSAAARETRECEEIVRNWLTFFADRHLGLGVRPDSGAGSATSTASAEDPADIRARFASWPSRAVDEDSVKRYVAQATSTLDPLEGIWQSVGGPYRLAILKDRNDSYVATILSADSVWWMPGQVKARFKHRMDGVYATEFFYRDHSLGRFDVVLDRNVLVGPQIVYEKVFPQPQLLHDVAVFTEKLRESANAVTSLVRLDSATLLMHLPTFEPSALPVIDSLVRSFSAELRSTPNLILDLRNNGGGQDRVYRPLLRFIYTRPITQYGASLLASDANIEYLTELVKNAGSEERRRELQGYVDSLRAHRGSFFNQRNFEITLDSVLVNPRRVAVIVNNGCASSCEEFVLALQQSDKTILFGENTAGILDYANVFSVDVPGTRFVLRYPSSRSRRLPAIKVDPDGIPPHVRIPASELFPIEWVRRYLADH